MKIVFLGPPASGKGVQSKLLSEYFNLKSVSTGDIIRNLIASGTDKGVEYKKKISAGDLIPDPDLIQIVQEYLSINKINDNFIADGFPRTSNQAKLLFDIRVFDESTVLIVLNVHEDILYKRLGIRSLEENRDDDNLISFKNRLSIFITHLESLKLHFKNVIEVDGNNSIDQVHNLILKKLRSAFHNLEINVK